MSEKSKQSAEKVISTALERFSLCQDAESEQRSVAADELRFSLGEQWPDAIRKERETDPNGARPCLTVDKLDQYIKQVVNDGRQNKPAIKVRPKDSGADPDTADVLQGVVRHIEDQSCADVAYDTAIEMAARAGFGYIRVLTDYCEDDGFLQDIYVRHVPNPFSCYLDPDHINPDGSDASYGFAFDDIPRKQFEAMYPDAEPCEFDSDEKTADWSKKDTIRLAEYFEAVDEYVTVWQAEDGSASETKIDGAASRKVRKRTITWRKITCKEVLEEREWPSKYIPIVPVYGHLINVEGKKRISSLIRPAMDAMRMYNYAASAFVERVALTPKAPYIATAAQIEGYETEWANANTANASVLPYNADPSAPPPQRQQTADIPAGWMQVMQGMEHDIQGALGMYNASLGAPSNEKSGKAILARQREADNATFHIIDNLSRAIRHVGRIVIDLIPKIYDSSRVIRILGEDGKEDFAEIDPEQPEAKRDIHDLQGKVVKTIYNPGVGRYDVTVTTGPAYGTKRQEAAEFITQLVQSSPDLMPVVGDLMFKSMDMPFAEEISERMRKMLPPPLQEQEDGPQIPLEVQSQMQSMSQQMQEMHQQLSAAAAELGDKRMEYEAKTADLRIKERELAIREYDAETKRLQVTAPAFSPEEIQAVVLQTLQDLATQQTAEPEPPPDMHMMPDGQMMADSEMPQPPQGGFFMPEQPEQAPQGFQS